MDADTAAKLRAPFPDDRVGKLPKVWCAACRKVAKDFRTCEQNGHTRKKCNVCKATLTSAHLHVDYVGHADVTDRLLQVDPHWDWEPLATTEDGLPALDDNTGLWIRLSVAGQTRIGYGHPDGKSGGDAVKEAIGDAIRNAAMRFGVALDLWRKESPSIGDPTPGRQQQGDVEIVSMRRSILAVGQTKGLSSPEAIEADYAEWSQGKKFVDADAKTLADYLAVLRRKPSGGAP